MPSKGVRALLRREGFRRYAWSLGIVCLAIDIGYVVAVRYEIWNAEDASALAGALQRDQLPDRWDQWGRPNRWYAVINEDQARQKAEETFQRNLQLKPILRNVSYEEITYQKMSRNRYKMMVRASVPLPLTTQLLRTFGYPDPVPWPIVVESIGGFQ